MNLRTFINDSLPIIDALKYFIQKTQFCWLL